MARAPEVLSALLAPWRYQSLQPTLVAVEGAEVGEEHQILAVQAPEVGATSLVEQVDCLLVGMAVVEGALQPSMGLAVKAEATGRGLRPVRLGMGRVGAVVAELGLRVVLVLEAISCWPGLAERLPLPLPVEGSGQRQRSHDLRCRIR